MKKTIYECQYFEFTDFDEFDSKRSELEADERYAEIESHYSPDDGANLWIRAFIKRG